MDVHVPQAGHQVRAAEIDDRRLARTRLPAAGQDLRDASVLDDDGRALDRLGVTQSISVALVRIVRMALLRWPTQVFHTYYAAAASGQYRATLKPCPSGNAVIGPPLSASRAGRRRRAPP